MFLLQFIITLIAVKKPFQFFCILSCWLYWSFWAVELKNRRKSILEIIFLKINYIFGYVDLLMTLQSITVPSSIFREKMEFYLSKKYEFIIILMNYNNYLQLSYSLLSFLMKTGLGQFKMKEKKFSANKSHFLCFFIKTKRLKSVWKKLEIAIFWADSVWNDSFIHLAL